MKFQLKALTALLATIGSTLALGVHAQAITVTSYGGAYGKSQIEAVHKPFTAKTGVKVLSEDYNGGLAEVRAQVTTGNVKWDVVDVELAESLRGCDEGLFEKFDASTLPKGDDGEWALMADGVAPADVYKVLATPAGVERAFKKLDTIKSQIVWWNAGAQPPQLLASGEVVMTTVYHGRIYDANPKVGKNFADVWDGQIIVPNLYVVVKGSKNVKAAMDYVRFATSTKPLAEQTKFIPYAPTRKSSLKLVDEKTKAWLPGSAHGGRGFQTDAMWWADHADELNQKFAAWLAK